MNDDEWDQTYKANVMAHLWLMQSLAQGEQGLLHRISVDRRSAPNGQQHGLL